MIITRIESIEIDNDQWKALEEYFEKPRNELELEEIADLPIICENFWHWADIKYIYTKVEER